jgi:hypothetical protein
MDYDGHRENKEEKIESLLYVEEEVREKKKKTMAPSKYVQAGEGVFEAE